MRNLIFALSFLWASSSSAQLTETQKRRTALVIKEAISDFQSSLGSVLGSAPKSQDIMARRQAISVIEEYVTPNCRF